MICVCVICVKQNQALGQFLIFFTSLFITVIEGLNPTLVNPETAAICKVLMRTMQMHESF